MRQRGRKSSAALTLVRSDDDSRMGAPSSLTADQRVVWGDVIRSMPADWFSPENTPLLEQYCVIIDQTRAVNKKMARQKVGSRSYMALITLEQKMIRHMVMLATKMRIAQQSTYDKSRRKGARDMKPAWDPETVGGGEGDEAEDD